MLEKYIFCVAILHRDFIFRARFCYGYLAGNLIQCLRIRALGKLTLRLEIVRCSTGEILIMLSVSEGSDMVYP